MGNQSAHGRGPFGDRPSTILGLLQRRYFRRLWAVTTVSSLGDWLGVFALTIYVKNMSGRPEFAVGGVLLFRVVPGLFFGPFAGVLADRFDRRRLMVTADLCRAALIATIPFTHNLWQVYAVSAAMEILSLLWAPSKDATVPNLVERSQLMTANQLSLITTYATFPLGGALVAVLAIPASLLARFDAFSVLRTQPVSLAFFVDAASFLFSSAMIATFPAHLMRTKRAYQSVGSWNPFRDLFEGFRFIRKDLFVRTLVVSAWVAFSGGSAIISLGPIFAGKLAGGSEAGAQAAWGALIVAVGFGLVGGMISASAIARRRRRESIFPAGLVLGGLAAIGVASMTSIRPALPITFLAGFGAGIAWVTIFTLLQERTDDRLRGRTFATLYTGIQLSLFVGLAGWPLAAGAIGDHVVRTENYIFDLAGSRIVLWAGGLFLVASGIQAVRLLRKAAGRPGTARLTGLRFTGLRFTGRALVAGGARAGLFVVFEGVEGAGKSTQMSLLSEWLRERGRHVVVTREPGGTAISEQVRHILLDPGSEGMDAKTEALLFAAARAQHVAAVIRPALDANSVVVSDRYIDSSIAYQGVVRGLGEEDVLRLNAWATDELLPDLVILLHLDSDVGLNRSAGGDRMENEGAAFHRKVGEAYLHLAREYPSRFSVVDASGTVEQVQGQIRAALLPFLGAE